MTNQEKIEVIVKTNFDPDFVLVNSEKATQALLSLFKSEMEALMGKDEDVLEMADQMEVYKTVNRGIRNRFREEIITKLTKI